MLAGREEGDEGRREQSGRSGSGGERSVADGRGMKGRRRNGTKGRNRGVRGKRDLYERGGEEVKEDKENDEY